jgi:hypothetical protein
MCLPAAATALPAIIGGISAVTGVVGSIAAYQQAQQQAAYQSAVAQQQADYQNAVNKQQVDYQNAVARQQAEFQNALAIQQTQYSNEVAMLEFAAKNQAFQQSETAFQQQIQLNNEAANRAYIGEQQKLNFEQKKAALEAQQFMVSAMQSQGRVLASGRTGQSVGLMAADASKEASRDLAVLGLSLGYAYQDYYTGTQSIFEQVQSQQNIAQGNRMLEPVKPIMATPTLTSPVLAPDPIKATAVRTPRPGPLGLISGIAGAGLSGVDAYTSLTARGY